MVSENRKLICRSWRPQHPAGDRRAGQPTGRANARPMTGSAYPPAREMKMVDSAEACHRAALCADLVGKLHQSDKRRSSVPKGAKAFCLSPASLGYRAKFLHDWIKAWKAHGSEGLNRKRGPKLGPRKLKPLQADNKKRSVRRPSSAIEVGSASWERGCAGAV
jgi:hypothetical protein